mmetsp:Transcript_56770/g.132988  ORF Transcript_56770/g.132988 Transcript_56770/m.132988 type:complete len:375 (-) Transcript_56770:2283-3407(-)
MREVVVWQALLDLGHRRVQQRLLDHRLQRHQEDPRLQRVDSTHQIRRPEQVAERLDEIAILERQQRLERGFKAVLDRSHRVHALPERDRAVPLACLELCDGCADNRQRCAYGLERLLDRRQQEQPPHHDVDAVGLHRVQGDEQLGIGDDAVHRARDVASLDDREQVAELFDGDLGLVDLAVEPAVELLLDLELNRRHLEVGVLRIVLADHKVLHDAPDLLRHRQSHLDDRHVDAHGRAFFERQLLRDRERCYKHDHRLLPHLYRHLVPVDQVHLGAQERVQSKLCEKDCRNDPCLLCWRNQDAGIGGEHDAEEEVLGEHKDGEVEPVVVKAVVEDLELVCLLPLAAATQLGLRVRAHERQELCLQPRAEVHGGG